MARPIIEVSDFTKKFGNFTAVDDLSFEVREGEVFAFLGANGSGKTTTIRCLLDIYQPTSGTLLINGKKYHAAMSSILGYLPEERGLYTDSKVLETLIYFGKLKGLEEAKARQWSADYLERVGLGDKADERIKSMSGGQQQKIQLGATIINQPELLILDEPTKGLDPVNRSLLMESLLELRDAGSTIIFITHQMDEVERLADSLVMIKDGKSVLHGGLDEVKRQFGSNTLHIDYTGKLPKNSKLYTAKIEGNHAELTPNGAAGHQEILRFLLDKDVAVRGFRLDAPSLNEIFIEVYS